MATTRSLWLPFILCAVLLPVHYADALTEPNNTIINITGYTAWGEDLMQTVIVVSNATWFDAVEKCKTLQGYIALSGSFGVPFVYIRQQLFIHFQELIGEPLWIGFHKPNLDGIWYIGTDCDNPLDATSYNTFANDDDTNRQCVLLNTTTNQNYIDFSWYAASCYERHSFICTKYLGTGYLKEYKGMAKLTTDALTHTKTVNVTSAEECKLLCYSYERYHCEFNSSSATCTTSERDMTYFPIEFNLTYVGIETISYVKSQYNEIVKTTVAVPNVTYNYTDFPCYTDPVQITASAVAATATTTSPPAVTSPTIATTTAEAVSTTTVAVATTSASEVATTTTTTTAVAAVATTTVAVATTTAVAATTSLSSPQSTDADFTSAVTANNTLYLTQEQVQQLVVEIKQENTIDVKTLSSYRNKFISVQDNRPSAKTIGCVGAICISLLIGLLVVSDVPKFTKDVKSLHNTKAVNTVKYEQEFIFKRSKLKNRKILSLRRNSI